MTRLVACDIAAPCIPPLLSSQISNAASIAPSTPDKATAGALPRGWPQGWVGNAATNQALEAQLVLVQNLQQCAYIGKTHKCAYFLTHSSSSDSIWRFNGCTCVPRTYDLQVTAPGELYAMGMQRRANGDAGGSPQGGKAFTNSTSKENACLHCGFVAMVGNEPARRHLVGICGPGAPCVVGAVQKLRGVPVEQRYSNTSTVAISPFINSGQPCAKHARAMRCRKYDMALREALQQWNADKPAKPAVQTTGS